ncbi:MAG TPA: hypothetical protein VD767_06490 [Thermomicrobiales bacterium]|nr:hypothetical protein [Thermomicrobiales bacterium]
MAITFQMTLELLSMFDCIPDQLIERSREHIVVGESLTQPLFPICYAVGSQMVDMGFSVSGVATHHWHPLAIDQDFELQGEHLDKSSIGCHSYPDPRLMVKVLLPLLRRRRGSCSSEDFTGNIIRGVMVAAAGSTDK